MGVKGFISPKALCGFLLSTLQDGDLKGILQGTPEQRHIPAPPRSRSKRSVVDAKLEKTSLSANAS